MAMIPRVKRILPRRSGILNALRKAESIGHALSSDMSRRLSSDDFDGTASGGDLGSCRSGEGVGAHLQGDADVPVAGHLHRGALAGQASADQAVRVDAAPLGEGGRQPLQVDHRPVDLVGVLEAAQLRQAPLQRHLATLETDRHGAAGLGALGAPAGGLALARALTTALAHPLLGRAGSGAEVVQLHSFTSSTFSTLTRWETLKTMPRISGRSSWTTTSRMRLSPRARMVSRCGLGRPISDRVWVILSLVRVVMPASPEPRQSPPGPDGRPRRPSCAPP